MVKMKSIMVLLLAMSMAQNLIPLAVLAAEPKTMVYQTEPETTEKIVSESENVDEKDTASVEDDGERLYEESETDLAEEETDIDSFDAAETEESATDSETADMSTSMEEAETAESEKSEESAADTADNNGVIAYLKEALFVSNQKMVDVASYHISSDEFQKLLDEVLKEANADELMSAAFTVDEDGYAQLVVPDVTPAMEAAIDELGSMRTTGTPLTTAQKQQILYLYNQYLTHYAANAQYLGVLDPYFISKETASELGPLGSLMVLAGYSVADIEAGNVSFDEIMGTIQILYYSNVFGIQFYGNQVLAAKNAVFQAIKDAGAVSEVDKLLTITEWLTQNCTFDLEFIVDMFREGCVGGATILQAQSPVDNPYKAAIKSVIYDQMYQNYLPQYGDATAKYYANMQAEQMADGVVSSWTGNLFGVFGLKKAACTGYAGAFSYLVQWMHPEVYGKNGAGTDLSKAENWRGRDELYYVTRSAARTGSDGKALVDQEGNAIVTHQRSFSTNAPYLVDYVRNYLQTTTRTLGQEYFIVSPHYWNAVKVDGKWYYVDVGFVDAYDECMDRERVETDGVVNHMMFMFSDTTARKFYDGYMVDIDTLYKGIATDESYEGAWFTFARSNIYAKDGYAYYFYNSTDKIGMLKKLLSGGASNMASMAGLLNQKMALVRHAGGSTDKSNRFTELVNFNDGTALNPATGKMVSVPMVKELAERMKSNSQKYPLISISAALYGNRFYFSLDNCILYYDLTTGDVVKVKEYNTVGAKRDKSVALGGLGFKVTDLKSAEVTVTNAPIAGMTIKPDGKMYVSIATNYAFVSGKSGLTDTSSYGYEFEQTNYNTNYAGYKKKFSFGTDTQNDNDEFMWCANFVEVLDMAHLAGTAHNYAKVTVDPFCGRDGFTEERCGTCGAVRAGSCVVDKGTALSHHYIKFNETYYTKVGGWLNTYNTGTSYVCTICKDSAGTAASAHVYAEPDESKVQWSSDYTKAVIKGHGCAYCAGKKLDCVLADSQMKQEDVTCAVTEKKVQGRCDQGLETVYTAKGQFNGNTVTVHKTVKAAVKDHTYNAQGICQVCGTKKTENPFPDVSAADYYYDPVVWASQKGIVSGMAEDNVLKFKPDASCTRAQAVTFMWRMKGQPEPAITKNPFRDIRTSDYYYKAVLWAYESGITAGKTSTLFAPDDTCTRGQFVTFLYRLEGKPSYSIKNPFADVQTGQYYTDSVLWAYENKVTSGMDDTHFGTEALCTRAHVVTFLYRSQKN